MSVCCGWSDQVIMHWRRHGRSPTRQLEGTFSGLLEARVVFTSHKGTSEAQPKGPLMRGAELVIVK